MTFIEAIARMEGFGANPDNIPTSHNNPGDICAGQWANAHGAIPGAPDPRTKGYDERPSRYAVFPTSDVGRTALRKLLSEHYVGLTLSAAIERYAPATENPTATYIRCMCEWTGMEPHTVLTAENIG